jgi:histidyl-tRNA synthetase
LTQKGKEREEASLLVSDRFTALKGVQDILPPDIYIWQRIESLSRDVFSVYGFQEIRPPIIEYTGLFSRSIGETTDIVEKEMYTFSDRAGRSITLRPEGTASVVRAYIEHHLYNLPAPQKFFYSGPMFRYERPQKGRFRQFHQIGVEAFGVAAPEMDAEVISMLRILLERLGLKGLNFEINSLGCDRCRPLYRRSLIDFFSGKMEHFCPDCKRRFEVNPLRLLDCKVERCIEMRRGSPEIIDFLCDDCKRHFDELLSLLNMMDIPFKINPEMVRGLDYYTRTTFEVTTQELGSQKAVAAGGRYDRLVEEFGGPMTPGIGFAIGMERIVLLLKEKGESGHPVPDLFIATLGKEAIKRGLMIGERLRKKGLWVEVNLEAPSLKSQLRKADRLSSRIVFIIGEEELASGRLKWKDMKKGSQGEIAFTDLDNFPFLSGD